MGSGVALRLRWRSVRLHKHRAHCTALLWSSGHRADSQHNQHNRQGYAAQLQRSPRPQPRPPARSTAPSLLSITVTSSLGDQCQSLERQKEGKRREDREKGRNNLFILACADCQLETAKGNEECVLCSVRTS
ncbi:hypothetical protein Q5P01_006214 [Channa striata]|uniref:Uncharacterized protein n=1 Tax=Channa striata TaxID=64152 RepID=A0AA88NH16_CHASR|nr:hypothetical protein Q5P01_006214 [Channa striata]